MYHKAAESDTIEKNDNEEERIKGHKISKLFETVDTKGQEEKIPNGGFYINPRNLKLQGTINEGAYGQIWHGVLMDGYQGPEEVF